MIAPIRLTVAALTMTLCSGSAGAQDMSSEEFAAKARSLGDRVNDGGNRSAECQERKQRAEELVGSPQRRYAAMQEYEALCGAGSGPALPAGDGVQFLSPAQ